MPEVSEPRSDDGRDADTTRSGTRSALCPAAHDSSHSRSSARRHSRRTSCRRTASRTASGGFGGANRGSTASTGRSDWPLLGVSGRDETYSAHSGDGSHARTLVLLMETHELPSGQKSSAHVALVSSQLESLRTRRLPTHPLPRSSRIGAMFSFGSCLKRARRRRPSTAAGQFVRVSNPGRYGSSP